MKLNLKKQYNKVRFSHIKFFRNSDIFYILIFCALGLVAFIKSSLFQKVMNSSEMVVIFASMTGAAIGGIITYLVNTNAIDKQNTIISTLKAKENSYDPLLTELKKFVSVYSCKNSRTINFNRRYANHSQADLILWNEIKSDGRYYYIPTYLRDELDLLQALCDDHQKLVEDALTSISDCIIEVASKVKKMDFPEEQQPKENHVRIKPHTALDENTLERTIRNLISKQYLDGEQELIKFYNSDQSLSIRKNLGIIGQQKHDQFIKEVSLKMYQTQAVKDFKKRKAMIIKQSKYVVKLLEKIVISIIQAYENHDRLL